MDSVAQSSSASRGELFSRVAERMNIFPGLVEKDFWVCWVLKHLYSVPQFDSHILFKGGTTLSKIFDVIRRFSEDIDLAVDYEMLGFTGDRSPHAAMSNTKRTKLLDEMLAVCREYIANEFLSLLKIRLAAVLADNSDWDLSVDTDDGHIVNFRYPSAAEAVPYVRPEVRLELGTHGELIPNDLYTVRPYAAVAFPDVFGDSECRVHAIKIERTFWEKLTILHQEHFRTSAHSVPSRYSRHYYDVYMMAKRSEACQAALQSTDLLQRVVEHKQRFYPRRWARYDLAVPATLQLMPSEDWLDYLHRDYDGMQIMLFGKSPTFTQILDGIQDLEKAIRQMPVES